MPAVAVFSGYPAFGPRGIPTCCKLHRNCSAASLLSWRHNRHLPPQSRSRPRKLAAGYPVSWSWVAFLVQFGSYVCAVGIGRIDDSVRRAPRSPHPRRPRRAPCRPTFVRVRPGIATSNSFSSSRERVVSSRLLILCLCPRARSRNLQLVVSALIRRVAS